MGASNPYDVFAHIHAWRFSLPDMEQNKDIPFYVSLARATGGPILALACGWGRVAIPLARAGYDVTGLDLSKPMLACGAQKLGHEPSRVRPRLRFLPGDMTGFSLGRRFRLIIIPANSLQCLSTIDGQRKAIGCAVQHLEDRGRLALEVNAGFKNLPDEASAQLRWTKYWEERDTAVRVYQRVWQDRERRQTVFDMHFELVDDRDRISAVDASERFLWTSRREMEELLREAGLRIVSSYSGYRQAPISAREDRMIFIATK